MIRHRRIGLWLGGSVVGIAVVIACSGGTASVGSGDGGSETSSGGTSGSSGSSGSSGTSGGMSSGGLVPGCPATLPAMGDACTVSGLECEYGNDIDLQCDPVATCVANAWQVRAARMGGCPTPGPGPQCAASYAAVPKGASCSPQGLSCAYPEGTCSCAVYCGPQGPVGHVCEAGTPTTWVCTGTTSSGCPAQRPRLGAPCSTEGTFCQYGDCDAPGFRCMDGSWHMQTTGCPVSSRKYKQDITYLSDDELRTMATRTLATRLATYQYKSQDRSRHLGFIIEDDPSSPAVLQGQDRVDLYGYTSMAVATLQVQEREIEQLRREVEDLRRELREARSKR